MKKYEYVNLDINTWLGAGTEEHYQVIDEYVAKGYRYIGFMPTAWVYY